jgi:hypothetical protein
MLMELGTLLGAKLFVAFVLGYIILMLLIMALLYCRA